MATLHQQNNVSGKKILFLINSLAKGGAERVFVNQLNALHVLGVDVSLATLYQPPVERVMDQDLKLASSKRKCFYFHGIVDLGALWSLYGYLKRERFDIVYSTLNEANVVARFFSCLFKQTAFITREASMPSKKHPKFKWWDRQTNRCISRIIVLSTEARISLLSYASKMDSRISILPNGVRIPPEKIPHSNKKRSLLTVGRCIEAKDQKTILEALAILQSQGLISSDHWVFHLVGDGPLMDTLKRRSSNLGLDSLIRFHGEMPHQQLAHFYNEADIFVLSSLWEGCPNTLLEAMSYGIPCVATSIGGVVDVLQDESTGLLVPSADPATLAKTLGRLMQDEVLRVRLGVSARQRMKDILSFEKHMDGLLTVFTESLNRSRYEH